MIVKRSLTNSYAVKPPPFAFLTVVVQFHLTLFSSPYAARGLSPPEVVIVVCIVIVCFHVCQSCWTGTTHTAFRTQLLYCGYGLAYFYVCLDDDLADWQLVEDIRVSVITQFSVLYINYTHTLLDVLACDIVYPVPQQQIQPLRVLKAVVYTLCLCFVVLDRCIHYGLPRNHENAKRHFLIFLRYFYQSCCVCGGPVGMMNISCALFHLFLYTRFVLGRTGEKRQLKISCFVFQYKDRIYQLLREARLYNPNLPDFDT